MTPLEEYERLIRIRNHKVLYGEKLDYHVDKSRKTVKREKQLMTYVSRVSVPQLDQNITEL